jgi:hypothetical protein
MSKELTNYNVCIECKEWKEQIEIAFLVLGEKLMNIRDKHLYVGSWESFEDYLKEIKMQPSVASRLIKVYKTFVVGFELPPKMIASAGGWSNAYEIAGKSQTKEEAVEWLERFEMADSDKTIGSLKKELRSGIKRDECSHSESYTIKICTRCGEKIREFEI